MQHARGSGPPFPGERKKNFEFQNSKRASCHDVATLHQHQDRCQRTVRRECDELFHARYQRYNQAEAKSRDQVQ